MAFNLMSLIGKSPDELLSSVGEMLLADGSKSVVIRVDPTTGKTEMKKLPFDIVDELKKRITDGKPA